MINRTNWKLYKEYLEYRSSVDLIANNSLQKEESHMRYLLEWAEINPFLKAKDIRPTFQEYMLKRRYLGQQGTLSDLYIKRVLSTARRFFLWLSDDKPGYRNIKQSWIKTLKIKRLSISNKRPEFISYEEIIQIARTPVITTADWRSRSMAIMLYLSGMRIGAFVSMPLKAVDIINKKLYQHPELGVRTKNRKHATTFLLSIDELLDSVIKWDSFLRNLLPDQAYWFPALSPKNSEIDIYNLSCPESRVSIASRNLKSWLLKNNLKYYNPHAFRHGHIHYGLKRSKNIEDYKAVSMNVMHSSMKITDVYYSILGEDEVENRINSLGNSNTSDDFMLFKKFIEWQKYSK